jgi:hypothetical protein
MQYNFDYSSSVDDTASFWMIHIIDLFGQYLLFYKVTYWSWEHFFILEENAYTKMAQAMPIQHVYSLSCGSL